MPAVWTERARDEMQAAPGLELGQAGQPDQPRPRRARLGQPQPAGQQALLEAVEPVAGHVEKRSPTGDVRPPRQNQGRR